MATSPRPRIVRIASRTNAVFLMASLALSPVLSVLPVFVPLAEAASSGPNSGATFASVDFTGADHAWSNPSRAATSNDSYASATITSSSNVTEYLRATNFGFNIPVGSTIDGIEVSIERHATCVGSCTSEVRDNRVRLVKAGTVGTTDRGTSANWPASDGTATYGGSSDLWGTTWTVANINHANTGVAVSAERTGGGDKTASVDHITMTVYYTPPVLPTTTTTVNCVANPVTYGSTTTCTATVTRNSGSNTPSGTVSWATSDSGGFTPAASCVLAGAGGTATCSVTYTPSAVGGGSHTITATYPGDVNFQGSSGNQAVTVNPTSLIITASSTSKTYGDTVVFAGTEFTSSGAVFGDSVTSVTLTSAGAAAGATVPGSPYTVVPSAAVGTGLVNYTISYVNGGMTVNKATLIVTADSMSRAYGDPNPGFTASYSGFVNGEVLGTSGVTGAPSLTTLATPSSPVPGPYTITAALGTLAAANYDFAFVDGALTITPATLTVSADSTSRNYGDANPAFTASYSGFVNGEVLGTSGVTGAPSLATTATPSSPVPGPYTITTALGTLAATNYSFTFVDGLLTVTLASTNTSTVFSAPNSSVVGDPVTLTGSVTGGLNPTGTVEFFDGATSIGTAPLANGSASISYTFTTVGSHSLTAIYSGDANHGGSTGGATTQVVDKASPSTSTVLSAPNSSIVGDPVTLTGSVTGGYGPTGTLEFFDGATSLGVVALSGGSASITVIFTTAGSHNLTAVYSGDANNNGSTSPTATVQVVDKASTSTSTVLSAPNASIVGDPVTLTGSVTGGFGPTGTVEFFDGLTSLGTAPLTGGAASMIFIFTAAGNHNLTAVYSGDANNDGSTSPTSTLQVVDKDSPTTSTVLSAPNASIVGDPVILTGGVVGGYNPTGTVEFFDGATSLGTAALSGGSASLTYTFTTVGTHSLTAVYSGDANNNGSTSPTATVQVVDKASPSTSTVLSAPNSSIVGDPVTLTGSVTGGYGPTGTLEFFDGATSLGVVALSGGSASIVSTFTTVGNHNLTAVYSGDANNNGSTSPTATVQVVDKAASATSTAIGVPNSSVVGQTVTFTALITGGYNPLGTVNFLDNGIVIGSGTLIAGTAIFSTSSLAVGSHPMTAEYLGDVNNNGSVSPVQTIQVVDASAVVVTLTSSANLTHLGDQLDLTATVTGYFPTGTVTFRDGGVSIGTAPLSGSGSAKLEISTLSLGAHALDAVYGGDINNLTGTSATISHIVNPQPTGGGGGGAGGGHGHSISQFNSVVGFMLTGSRNGGLSGIAPGAYGGGGANENGQFTPQQIAVICAVQRSVDMSRNGSVALGWLTRLLAGYFGVSPAMVEPALRDRSLCTGGGSAFTGSVHVVDASRVLPVDAAGVPLSTNPVWNACIRHQVVFSAESMTPMNCARYHVGHLWQHPDTRLAFKWSDTYRKMLEVVDREPIVVLPVSR